MTGFYVEHDLLKGESLSFLKSPNIGLRFKELPKFIVLHFTAHTNTQEVVDIFMDPTKEVSAHLLIDRKGNVTQFVPFNTIAWHAGVSDWKDYTGLNAHSIGIEIDNAGELKRDGAYIYNWQNLTIPADEVFEFKDSGTTTYWHKYPDMQIACVIDVCAALRRAFPIEDIVGHSDIAPGRKVDPGPAFPMKRFKSN